MNGERAHDRVVSDLNSLQGRLRGVEAAQTEPDPVTVIEGDVSIRVSDISERIARLEHDLARVTARVDQATAERHPVRDWQHFPEFNFAPQVFQLTLDDQIALLQGTIAERLDHES
ncbi:MAG: hypothetical protein ACRDH7_14085 [Actinomycetota bacterium]